MFRIFQKKNKSLGDLYQIERSFLSYTGSNIPYKSTDYWEIMQNKLKYGLQGFKSHPSLFDVMIKDNQSYFIGKNHKPIEIN